MKTLEFKDINKVRYFVYDEFKAMSERTQLYRMLGKINGDAISHRGKLYRVSLYAQNFSVAVEEVMGNARAMSEYEFDNAKDNDPVCKALCYKILKDWMKQTLKLCRQERKIKREKKKLGS